MNTYRLVIGSYPTKDKADKRVFNLKKGGNIVDLVQLDSTNYIVLSTVNCRVADTAHVIDSMKRMFGYKGVTVYKN